MTTYPSDEAKARDRHPLLVDLIRSEGWMIFDAECLGAREAELDATVHDLSKTPEQRTDALIRWHEIKAIRAWVPEQRKIYEQVLKSS